MIKVIIDNNRFNTYYHPAEKTLFIFDKENNRVVKTVKDDSNFVYQFVRNDKVLFLKSTRIPKTRDYYLSVFDVYGQYDPYYDEYSFILKTGEFDKDYLGNGCFILKDNQIISLVSEQICGHFDNIVQNESTKQVLGNNIILVSNRYIDSKADIIEEITYGINTEDFSVSTSIYSQMQNRFIKLLSDEELEKAKRNYKEFKDYTVMFNDSLDKRGSDTIRYEIIRPFNIVASHMIQDGPKESKGYKIDFMKKLINN